MKILTVVGARPQFIKAAAVSREIRRRHTEVLVHTGQHYDYGMSGVFFEALGLPAPDVNLEVGSGSHGAQTGSMLAKIEEVILREKPDWVLVYGDTNSTLAGALAAAKLHVRIAHVEAGLRSFNRRMPEEINRVLTDHLSDRLFCPSESSVRNLAAEGVSRGVHVVGDVMRDVLELAREQVRRGGAPLAARLGLAPGSYLLATIHRSENTDDPRLLGEILGALNALAEPIVLPLHPRTRKVIAGLQLSLGSHVQVLEPLPYFDMVALTEGARLVLTDSGGLQKEAFWLKVPCITLRQETEWVETVSSGWNLLAGADRERILDGVRRSTRPKEHPPLYGEGNVGARCVELLD